MKLPELPSPEHLLANFRQDIENHRHLPWITDKSSFRVRLFTSYPDKPGEFARFDSVVETCMDVPFTKDPWQFLASVLKCYGETIERIRARCTLNT